MSMMDKKVFKSEFDAWKWVHEMFPDTQWYFDHESSERAGYKTYRDTEEFYNYVCELNDRVEVNLKDGNRTINLWLEKEVKEDVAQENYRNYEITARELTTICDSLYLCANAFASNDIESRQFKNIDDIIYKLNLIKKLRDSWYK